MQTPTPTATGTHTPTPTASFVYDGDGVRVKGTVGGVTTTYIGSHFEWTGSTGTMLKYYYAGGARIAMRQGSTLYFLLSDHLGSTHKMANADGSNYTTHLYKAWGEKRYPSGASGLLTTFRFTGQRQEVSLGGVDGLYFYGSRWYDVSLGRWTQPDTVVPDPYHPLDWDRFAYARNNAVRYTDPTGHAVDPGGVGGGCPTYACGGTTPSGNGKGSPGGIGTGGDGENNAGGGNPTNDTAGSSKPLFNLPIVNKVTAAQDQQEYCLQNPWAPACNGQNPPRDELTYAQMVGLGLSAVLVDVIIGAFELCLLDVVGVSSIGGPLAVVVEVALLPIEIAAADFAFSYTLMAAKSIASGHKVEYSWTFMPAIAAILPKPAQQELHNLIPRVFP